MRAPDLGAIDSSAVLLSIARAMEEWGAECYRELADSFEIYNNLPTAAAFRELAEREDRHAAEFPAVAGGAMNAVPPSIRAWMENDPEIADPSAVHYLMLPWHVFDMGLRHEEQARAFFVQVAERALSAEVRDEALRMVERESVHAAEMKARRDASDFPPDDWDEDADPDNWDGSD
jgi:rubrerythrin